MVWDTRNSSSGSNYHLLSSAPHISYLHSISPILQTWKLRLRKASQLAQDWTASNLRCRDSKPGVPGYKTQPLSSASCFNLAFVPLLNLPSASLYRYVSSCSLQAELRITISSYHHQTAGKWQSQDSNPGCLTPGPALCTTATFQWTPSPKAPRTSPASTPWVWWQFKVPRKWGEKSLYLRAQCF